MFKHLFTGFRRGAIFVPILGNLRGSVGDNTFSHNRGGDYVRRRSTPTNPNSTRQQTMRSLLGTYAAAWAGLTTAQREAWNTWAESQSRSGPLGNSINLTGINAYVMLNTRIVDSGNTAITSPPVDVAPDALSTFSVDISAATTGTVTFTPTPLGADEQIQMYMSLPQSGAAEPNFKQCRIVGYSTKAQASTWDATLPFSVQAGQKVVFFAARFDSATGLISAYLRTTDTADFV